MNKIRSLYRQFHLPEKFTPLAFLLVCVLSFGLLANRLGFYQDDWPYIFYAFNKGIPSLAQELYYDSRPNAAWLYIGLFYLLGFKPVLWHMLAVILRWLTATVLWYLFRRIWPAHNQRVKFAILLFIIHPSFLIQPYAVNSILYWAGYLLFAASLLIMARNAVEQKHKAALTTLAVFMEAAHLFTSEYFIGMVLIRPFILYWILDFPEHTSQQRIRKVLSNWAPYLIAPAAYVIWRIFLYIPPPIGDRNAPEVLYAMFSAPLSTLAGLARTALQDSVIITFTSWYRTFTPELLALNSIFGWVSILAAVIVCSITLFSLNRSKTDDGGKAWLCQPIIMGISLLLLGMLPIWLIGEDIVTHKNQFAGSRFGIGSTLGAALILAVIIDRLIINQKKALVISICVALAFLMHLTNEKEFADAWEKQQRLAQQLVWRAPHIATGTAIVTDEEILGHMGGYSVSFAIITAYQPGDIQSPPYWYFPFYYTNPDVGNFLNGIPLEAAKLSMNFSGSSKQMLLLSFNPELKRCLWVLSSSDANLRLINKDMRQLSAGSDVNLIQQADGAEPSVPENIFGKQKTQTWCYYFEKADLARQYQQWDEIARLWKEAQANGDRADNGFEYIPFIEGFGHLEDWDYVKSQTKFSNKITAGLEPSLCSMLNRLAADAPASSQRDETINNLKDDLHCINYQ